MKDLMSHSVASPTALQNVRSPKPVAGLPWPLYGILALASIGSNLLITAIFFFTATRFHWNLKQNFLLATGQGVFYIAGAMSAARLRGGWAADGRWLSFMPAWPCSRFWRGLPALGQPS